MKSQETQMQAKKQLASGVGYGILAYGSWGLLPVYWKTLKAVPSLELLAHRIVWSFVFVSAVLLVLGRWHMIREVLAVKRNRWGVLLASLFVSLNWFTYIWSVNSGHVVEASLGYYITPFFMVLLGLVVLRERLDLWQSVSLLIALAGVTVITFEYGQVPWVALALAVTFALYGLVKKLMNLDSLTGLALETVCVLPLALGYLLIKEMDGSAVFGHLPWLTTVLLLASGAITAMPLFWFANGTKRIPLSTMGFIQYLSPSLQLMMGVLVFGEPFSHIDLISFSLIWLSLALYSVTRTGIFQRSGVEKKLSQSAR
ncbi:EamA family transporter RarD [Paradesulfitobacterium ferrireducens]|uniref:EamA family transporter RarD n=1 Tax=Paradesulfitobacterium ferrireducens TaxID=2816476 RepID=UPI001A8F167A|nr:EamA family transporter RarD [Paradesulfitobacterium ferrireducens]